MVEDERSTPDRGDARAVSLMRWFVGVAALGWLVSAFLSVIHFWALPQIPEGADLAGSLEVITSDWGYVAGIPLATLGAVYYLATIAMAAWWFETRHPAIIKALTPVTASGVLASAYFVWLQLVPIGEICPFCMVSAGAPVVLFALELRVLRRIQTPDTGEVLYELARLAQDSETLARASYAAAFAGATLFVTWAATFAPVPGT